MPLKAQWLSGKLEDNFLLSISFAVSDCDRYCSQLQVVQVFYGNHHQQPFPAQVQTHNFNVGAKIFEGLVDRSPTSPAVVVHHQEPGHRTKPYYYGMRELRKNASGCHITIFDQPHAVLAYRDAYLETAIVCVDYMHSGSDRILKVLRWGWIGHPAQPANKTFWPSPRALAPAVGNQPEQGEVPSPEFREIVRHFYPDHRFTVRRGAH